MKRKSKTVHYIKYSIDHLCDFDDNVRYKNLSFTDYLQQAVNAMKNKGEIQQFLNSEGRKVVLSLYEKELIRSSECLTGALFITQAGKKVAAASALDEGTKIVPAQTVIEDEGANNPIFVNGLQMVDPAEQITCFACTGDHLAYISDSPTAAKRLYDFFYYLLKSLTHTLPETTTINEDRDIFVNPSLVLKHKGISSVSYKFSNCGTKEDLDYQIHGILGSKLGSDPIFRCQQQAILQECNINLNLSLGRRNRGMKAETLKNLLVRMSDSELSKTTVHFNDGHQMQGSKFRPDSRVKIGYNDSVIDQIDAQRAAAAWLRNQINNGIIQ